MQLLKNQDIETMKEYETHILKMEEKIRRIRKRGHIISSILITCIIGATLGTLYMMLYSWGGIKYSDVQLKHFQEKVASMQQQYRWIGGAIGAFLGVIYSIINVDAKANVKNFPWK
jgi:hypothetical protein